MKTMPLIKTNKYLRNPVTRKKILVRNAIDSARIEGIRITEEITDLLNSEGKGLKIKSSKRASVRGK